jgi:hypothetical protein
MFYKMYANANKKYALKQGNRNIFSEFYKKPVARD